MFSEPTGTASRGSSGGERSGESPWTAAPLTDGFFWGRGARSTPARLSSFVQLSSTDSGLDAVLFEMTWSLLCSTPAAMTFMIRNRSPTHGDFTNSFPPTMLSAFRPVEAQGVLEQ